MGAVVFFSKPLTDPEVHMNCRSEAGQQLDELDLFSGDGFRGSTVRLYIHHTLNGLSVSSVLDGFPLGQGLLARGPKPRPLWCPVQNFPALHQLIIERYYREA